MTRKRFSLPERCVCGAHGRVTFEEGAVCPPGELHPQLKVVDVEGPFRLDSEGKIFCLNCSEAAVAK